MNFRLKCNQLENASHSFVSVFKAYPKCLVREDLQKEMFL